MLSFLFSDLAISSVLHLRCSSLRLLELEALVVDAFYMICPKDSIQSNSLKISDSILLSHG